MRINLNDKEKVICTRLSDDMYRAVKECCDIELCTMSEFIRISIDAFLEARNKSFEIKKSIGNVSIEYTVDFSDGV